MFSSSSRPIQPYRSIPPRPIPVGSIRSRSGFPKFNAMSSLGESSLPRPTYPESLSVTSSSTTKPPLPSAGELRMLIIALNQSLNEPLTQRTSYGWSRFHWLCSVPAFDSGGTNAEVVNVDKLTYAGNPNSLKMIDDDPRYRFVRADICDEAPISQLFAETVPDAVINLAAESHVDRSITGSRSFIETNILGTYTLLEAARRYWSSLSDEAKGDFRFLHVSTDEVYGSLGADGFFTESTPYDPSSPYSASKP